MRVRRLARADIPSTADLEQRAFESGWSPTSFEHELGRNRLAHYLVAEPRARDPRLAGFGGLWTVADQAHVVAVGVEPALRHRGIGRLLVVSLLSLAQTLGLTDATLECRISNRPARRLYSGLGFHVVGRRIRYYENEEDAVIMTTEPFESEGFRSAYGEALRAIEERWPHIAGDLGGLI